ncbi:MAG: DUF3872 domain-containing protein [Tannerella sp.]|nr:DUF3872 domain-containing protein [Tannerella sp.]
MKKTDDRNTTNYRIRYFQPDGKGALALDNGTVFIPNDLYSLSNQTFRLYYTSHCAEAQVIDVYIEDDYGQVRQKSFSFQHNEAEDNTED